MMTFGFRNFVQLRLAFLSEITNCDLSVCRHDKRRVWVGDHGHTDSWCVKLCRPWRLGKTTAYPNEHAALSAQVRA